MILILSIAIALLFASGAYLLLKHDLIRVAVGMVLISNAANLFIMSAGLTTGAAPLYPLPEDQQVADPVVQGMTLTAIVIGFGVTALLLSLVYRVYTSHLSIDLDDLAAAEEREEAALEAVGGPEPTTFAASAAPRRRLVGVGGRDRKAE